MVEEITEPPPPDIRNRYPRSTRNRKENAANRRINNSHSICELKNNSVTCKSDNLTRSIKGPYRSISLPFVLFLTGLAYLPTSFAYHVSPSLSDPSASFEAEFYSYSPSSDPFTSGPQLKFNHQRPTPILSLLSTIIESTLCLASKAAGFELVLSHHDESTHHFLGKRLSGEKTAEAIMIPVLVLLSGVFAGLTLGYFSVDPTQLQVLSISGTPKQQEYARRILPIRKNSHLLLTTLILANMIVNEALPVIADPVLGGGVQAVIISTALVVIFSEIIPQSICSRYGLLIGATMAKPVRVLTWIFFPIAWPVAKLLEYILGAHHGIIYRRSELRELIKMHAAGGEGGGDLDFDTVTMAQGALDLAAKFVKDAMTPIDNVFMLPIEAKLDYETLGQVVRSGHSRIPVYQMVEVPDINLTSPEFGCSKTKLVKKVLGCLLVKSCVLLDPEDATPLATIPINAIPSVPWNEPLTNMLNAFQEGRSHMAIVSRRGRKVENDPEDAESVMTAAAGGLRQRLLKKVAEISHGKNGSGSDSDSDEDIESGKRRQKRKRSQGSSSGGSPTSTIASPPSAADKVKAEAQTAAADAEEKKKQRLNLSQAAKLNSLEQSVPADAELPPERVEMFFDGLEGAPLGIITLEDVLEELIGEEIYDEYDEHGGPRNAASAFVPREAALAARQAALDREKEKQKLAESTPLPAVNDAGFELSAGGATTKRTVMPKLPLNMPKFSLKRPASGPGKLRSAVAEPLAEGDKEKHAMTAAAGNILPNAIPPRQALSHEDITPTPAAAAPPAIMTAPTVESPGEIEVSENATKLARSGSGLLDPSKSVSFAMTPNEATEATATTDATTAIPTNQATGAAANASSQPVGIATTGPPVVAASPLLTEALLIERGRRRLAAAGGVAPGTTPVLRTTSVSGTPRAPSRQPTPPVNSVGPSAASTVPIPATGTTGLPTPGATGAGGQILSPMPRKTPKFKSVPAPLAGIPIPSSEAVPSASSASPSAQSKGDVMTSKDGAAK